MPSFGFGGEARGLPFSTVKAGLAVRAKSSSLRSGIFTRSLACGGAPRGASEIRDDTVSPR